MGGGAAVGTPFRGEVPRRGVGRALPPPQRPPRGALAGALRCLRRRRGPVQRRPRRAAPAALALGVPPAGRRQDQRRGARVPGQRAAPGARRLLPAPEVWVPRRDPWLRAHLHRTGELEGTDGSAPAAGWRWPALLPLRRRRARQARGPGDLRCPGEPRAGVFRAGLPHHLRARGHLSCQVRQALGLQAWPKAAGGPVEAKGGRRSVHAVMGPAGLHTRRVIGCVSS
mmetsp:Transcript_79556/g.245353  ORF Transcript_79556/g.245353 Transcript_79556/m.245353 type:complete len:227 (+) Transcript_79556:574-1254(+)